MPTASELITRIEVQGVDQYVRDMGKAEQVTDKTAKNMDQAGKQAGGLGSGFGSAAKQAGVLAAGLGAFDIGKSAIGGLFGAMESGTKTVGSLQAQLGLTKDEAQELGRVGTEVFRNNFAGSMGEAAAAAGQVQQMLGAMDTSSLQTATENAFRLSDAFGVDTSESLSAVKTLMDNFGLSSQEAFDLVTSGFQKGLDRSGDFLDTINEYSTQFKNGGADAGQFFSLLQSGLQGGVLGTDKAADAFKEFGVRIQDGSKTTREALTQLIFQTSDLSEAVQSGALEEDEAWQQAKMRAFEFTNAMRDGSVTTTDAFQSVITMLGQVDDKNIRLQAGVGLLGTQFEDLGAEAVLGLSLAGASVEDAAGKTQALDAQYGGLGNTIESLKRQALTGFLQPLADQMGGVVNAAIPLVGALGSLSLAIPALLPVIGPVVAILSGPLTLAIVGIGAAIAVLVLAWTQNWGDIQGKTQAVINVIAPIIDGLGDRLREFGAVILPELSAAWQSLSDNIGTIANGIRDIVEPIFNGIRDFFNAHSAEINAILQGMWDAVIVIFNTMTGIISNNIQFWLNILQGDWSGAWQNIKNIVDIAWTGIKEAAEIFLSTILPNAITIGKAAVLIAWNAFWDEIKASVNNAINGENGVIALVKAMPGAILDALSGIGSLLTQIGADLIQGFINGVNSLWNSAISFVKNLFGEVVNGVKSILGIDSPSTIMKGIGVDFIQGFIDGTGSMAGALKDFVAGLVSGAVGAAREAAGGVIGAIGGAVSGAAGAVGGAIGGVLPGGGGSGDSVPIERTTADGRIGYAPGAVTLSEAQVRDLVNQAMAITGIQMSPQEYEGYINRLRNESGFNTGVVNLWDVNARNGTPSIGIGQTIGPTFRGHALPGYGDILNPLHNIIASLRYIRARYPRGAPPPLPGVPYAEGGTVKPGWFTVGERGFELGHLGPDGLRIFSNEQSQAMISGMSGGGRLPGFQGGSHSKGNLSLAMAWAAAAMGDTSPGAIAAFEQGMQMMIDYQSDQLIAIEAEERKREELKRLALQISHLGGTTFANEIFTDLSDGVISLDEAISALLGEIKNLRKRARGGGGSAAGGGGGGQLADVLGTAEPGLGRVTPPGTITVVLNVDSHQIAQVVTPAISGEIAMLVQGTAGTAGAA